MKTSGAVRVWAAVGNPAVGNPAVGNPAVFRAFAAHGPLLGFVGRGLAVSGPKPGRLALGGWDG